MAPRSAPRLSWQVTGAGFNVSQSAYRVLASSSREAAEASQGDLWDTGKVAEARSLDATYGGEGLLPGQRVYWRVKLWDAAGEEGAWSDVAMFGAPLPDAAWTNDMWIGLDALPGKGNATPPNLEGASWIAAAPGGLESPEGSIVLGKVFSLPGGAKVKRAVAWATGDDHYDLSVNGRVFASNDNWRAAEEHDITDCVAAGVNTLRVRVDNHAAGPTGLLLRIRITFEDGESMDVDSDASWVVGRVGDQWKLTGENEPPVRVIAPSGAGPWQDGVRLPGEVELQPAAYMRHGFDVPTPVTEATLYVTALGFVDAYVNGTRVTEHFVSDWTDYEKRVYAYAYDVTEHIARGQNAMGLVLGDGWFSGYLGYGRGSGHYGEHPRAAARLVLRHADGSRRVVRTGDEWRAETGPIRAADMFMGEVIDLSVLRTKGFSKPDFDDTDWVAVSCGCEEVDPVVEPSPGVPIAAFHEFEPVRVTEPVDGTYVYDMGRNFAGVVRMQVNGTSGQKITVRYGERLNTDGTLYRANLRFARATDTFICSGGDDVFEPRFTFHGFQYVEVTGLPDAPNRAELVGVAIGSQTPTVGRFDCSSDLLNKLASNVYWTQRSNFISVPTDCPQRDERLGWMGDAQVYIRTAGLWCDVQAFMGKWLIDVIDATEPSGNTPKFAPVIERDGGADGGPAWADAATIVPWACYLMYDDLALLERQYDNMRGYVDFQTQRATADRLPPKSFHAFGDWLDVEDPTPKEVIYMAYWAESTRLVMKTARLIGREEEAARYEGLLREITAAFVREYVDDQGRVRGKSQTAYVLALRYGLLRGERYQQAAQHLVKHIESREGHLSTGFIGTKDLMLVLNEIGRSDVAYRLALNEDYPSWGFSIRHGATSIWERWDGWTPDGGFQDVGMNSFAHYSFGAVYQWMVETIGGIQLVDPGYAAFRVAPVIDGGLTHADVGVDTVRGSIRSDWRVRDGRIHMRVEVPGNTRCDIVVPCKDPSTIEVNGEALRAVEIPGLSHDGRTLSVGSGVYVIDAR